MVLFVYFFLNITLCSIPKLADGADDRYELWCRALSTHADPPYKGMICAYHFHEDDFLNKSKRDRLKKNAVPTVFDHGQNDQNNGIEENYGHSEEFVSQVESNENHQHTESTEIALHQVTSETSQNESNGRSYQLLYQQYIGEKAKMNVREEKLKQKIKKLERDVDSQKKHIRFLNQKLLREQKSKDGLNNLLKELHAEKLLDEKNLKSLEVSFFPLCSTPHSCFDILLLSKH